MQVENYGNNKEHATAPNETIISSTKSQIYSMHYVWYDKVCSAQTQTRIGLLEEIPEMVFRFPAFTTGPLRRTRTLCDQAQTPV